MCVGSSVDAAGPRGRVFHVCVFHACGVKACNVMSMSGDVTKRSDCNEQVTGVCPICLELSQLTVLPGCKHGFCSVCLPAWSLGHRTCPTCRAVMDPVVEPAVLWQTRDPTPPPDPFATEFEKGQREAAVHAFARSAAARRRAGSAALDVAEEARMEMETQRRREVGEKLASRREVEDLRKRAAAQSEAIRCAEVKDAEERWRQEMLGSRVAQSQRLSCEREAEAARKQSARALEMQRKAAAKQMEAARTKQLVEAARREAEDRRGSVSS